MYNLIGAGKGLSLIKVIGGISKTLQIAGQVIPLYQKAKPMISNAKNMIGLLKEINKKEDSPTTIPAKKESLKPELKTKKAKELSSTPTFFL